MKKLLCTTLSLGAIGLINSAQCQESAKPNVLFIFLDDLTHDAIGALGDRGVKTPNIDKLVSSGTAFSTTYMMGGWHGAYSVASRSQLLTGRFMWHSLAEQEDNYTTDIQAQNTWPQVMRQAGYHTFMTGKWHVAHVNAKDVFDVVDTPRAGGMPKTVEESYSRPIEGQADTWSPYDETVGGYWEGGKHWSEVQADVSIDFINKNASCDKPLFMYCAFNAPHDPRQAPKEYVDMYPLNQIEAPKNFLPEHPFYKEMGAAPGTRDERLAPYPRSEFAIKTHMQEYYSIISHADTQIGRILDAVEQNGMMDNTIIIFAADNGLAMGQHGFIGKQSLYDHSIRVPLVFSGPGIPEGERRDQMVYLHDLVPTIYDILGIEIPSQIEYESQYDVIKDNKAKGREYIYAGYGKFQRAIRDERYKMIFIPSIKYVYLFDLEKDPNEIENLYGQKRYDKVVEKLVKEYVVWSQKSGDQYDLAADFPELF